MATIPEQYESQRVGVQGYRVLNLDLDGVCADYKGAIRDYLQRQGIDVPERALQTAHYNLTREDGWPFETLDDYIETHKAAEREHLYATMKPLPGVAQALQRLANEHVYIRIVTHRLFVSGQHQMVVSDTAQWLDSNRIPYMSLCFTGLKEVCRPRFILTIRRRISKLCVRQGSMWSCSISHTTVRMLVPESTVGATPTLKRSSPSSNPGRSKGCAGGSCDSVRVTLVIGFRCGLCGRDYVSDRMICQLTARFLLSGLMILFWRPHDLEKSVPD